MLLLFLLALRQAAYELAHEVGEPKDGEDEDDEGFLAGAGGDRLPVWTQGARWGCRAGEGEEVGGGEGGGVGRGWAATQFGEEGAHPAEEGVDSEDGAEGLSEVAKLFGD